MPMSFPMSSPLPHPLLLRSINNDILKSSCHDIDDIARRLGNNEPLFARNIIQYANYPRNVFLRNELLGDVRFKYYWMDLRNDFSKL